MLTHLAMRSEQQFLEKWEEILKLGKESFREGDYLTAARRCSQVLHQECPLLERPKVLLMRGVCHLCAGNFMMAYEDFRGASSVRGELYSKVVLGYAHLLQHILLWAYGCYNFAAVVLEEADRIFDSGLDEETYDGFRNFLWTLEFERPEGVDDYFEDDELLLPENIMEKLRTDKGAARGILKAVDHSLVHSGQNSANVQCTDCVIAFLDDIYQSDLERGRNSSNQRFVSGDRALIDSSDARASELQTEQGDRSDDIDARANIFGGEVVETWYEEVEAGEIEDGIHDSSPLAKGVPIDIPSFYSEPVIGSVVHAQNEAFIGRWDDVVSEMIQWQTSGEPEWAGMLSVFRKLFGNNFQRGFLDLGKFFGRHERCTAVEETSRRTKPRSKTKKKQKTTKTSNQDCIHCWADSLFSKRFAWFRDDETCQMELLGERAVDALVFIMMLQLELRFTKRHLVKEQDAQYILSKCLLQEGCEPNVVRAMVVCFGQKAVSAETLDELTSKTFQLFAEESSHGALDEFGVELGMLCHEEISCYKMVSQQVLVCKNLIEAKLNGIRVPKYFWTPFENSDAPPCVCCGGRVFIKAKIRERVTCMVNRALGRIHANDFLEASVLLSKANSLQKGDIILLHLMAVIEISSGNPGACLELCARAEKKLENFRSNQFLSSAKIDSIRSSLETIKDLCFSMTGSVQDHSQVHRSNDYFVSYLGKVYETLKQQTQHDSVRFSEASDAAVCLAETTLDDSDDLQPSRIQQPNSNDQQRSMESEMASLPSCVLRNCLELTRQLQKDEKWAECMCSEGCLLSFHKRCWRSVQLDLEMVCATDSCTGKIVCGGIFMTSENREDQEKKLQDALSLFRRLKKQKSSVAESFHDSRPVPNLSDKIDSSPSTELSAFEGRSKRRVKKVSSSLRKEKLEQVPQRRTCIHCGVHVNSKIQWQGHLEGKKHRQELRQCFIEALRSQLTTVGGNVLSTINFNSILRALIVEINESFGNLEELGRDSSSGLVVSKDARGHTIVGFRFSYGVEPEANERENNSDATEHSGRNREGQVPVRRLNSNSESYEGNYEAESEMIAQEFGASLALDDEDAFPALGEERGDPLIRAIAQLSARSQLSRSSESLSDNELCDICWGLIPKGQRIVIMPCGHHDVCASCVANHYRRHPRDKWVCHKCRGKVEDLVSSEGQQQVLKKWERKKQRGLNRDKGDCTDI